MPSARRPQTVYTNIIIIYIICWLYSNDFFPVAQSGLLLVWYLRLIIMLWFVAFYGRIRGDLRPTTIFRYSLRRYNVIIFIQYFNAVELRY